jgi:hypothetical protein
MGPPVCVLRRWGRARQVDDGLVREYLAAPRETMDAETAAEFEKACREMCDQMARIAIRPWWAGFYDFSTGRIPQFLQDLPARAAP